MFKNKKTKLDLNFRVLIEKEFYDDGSSVYVANVPSLGISDYADSIEAVLVNIEKLIKFHLDSLIQEDEELLRSDDSENIIITTSKISLNSNQHPAKAWPSYLNLKL